MTRERSRERIAKHGHPRIVESKACVRILSDSKNRVTGRSVIPARESGVLMRGGMELQDSGRLNFQAKAIWFKRETG